MPALRASALRLAALLLGGALAFSAASAQDFVTKHGDWNVVTYAENGKKFCYIHSEPIKEDGDYTRRGDAYLLVIHRTGGGEDQVSVHSGYPYKEGTEVEVTIGDAGFKLFVRGDKAWTYPGDGDRVLIGAMVHGLTMTVKGTSRKDTYSLDTYSLVGFTKARTAMGEACR
ncbi:MAG: hypothetical protein O7A65_09345 [Proteobacteria bacterium]|nr:hypothetical protein [Pseudomonadota bacterium]